MHYYRWGGFIKLLEDCRCGVKIESVNDLKSKLSGTYEQIASDIQLYLHNFDTGVTVNANRLLREYHELDKDTDNNID